MKSQHLCLPLCEWKSLGYGEPGDVPALTTPKKLWLTNVPRKQSITEIFNLRSFMWMFVEFISLKPLVGKFCKYSRHFYLNPVVMRIHHKYFFMNRSQRIFKLNLFLLMRQTCKSPFQVLVQDYQLISSQRLDNFDLLKYCMLIIVEQVKMTYFPCSS